MNLTVVVTTSITPSDASAADIERLIGLVSVIERTQRTEDVDGFLSLFDADAVWITGGGRRLVGREAIAAFTRTVLPGAMTGQSVRYEVAHIRFITPDVALTSVNQEYVTMEGAPLPARQLGRPTYVWHRQGQDWLIASGQNTTAEPEPVDEGPDLRTAGFPAQPASSDVSAIQQIVADMEQGFNHNSPDLLTRHLATDALTVNAVGAVLRGRFEIDATVQAALASGPLREATAHYRLTDITLLAPDVAVAHKSAWSTPSEADAGEPPEMNALYVLVRRDGRWWVVRRQNTLIARASASEG